MPYATSFDHLRVADEVHFKFERCLKALGPQAIMLRRYGVGHSLGALLHALIASRYPIVSAGNVLMSFNNRPATGQSVCQLLQASHALISAARSPAALWHCALRSYCGCDIVGWCSASTVQQHA